MCGGNSAKTDRNQTLKGYGELGDANATDTALGSSLTSAGESDTGAASEYFRKIMSGDPSAIAPETNALNDQANQQKQQIEMNGNRTGGNNAQMQQLSSDTSGKIADALLGAQSGAAKSEAGVGEAETGEGLGANSQALQAASALTNASSGTRAQSQQIHNASVQNFTDALGTYFGI